MPGEYSPDLYGRPPTLQDLLQQQLHTEQALREAQERAHALLHTHEAEARAIAQSAVQVAMVHADGLKAEILRDRDLFVDRRFYLEQHGRLTTDFEVLRVQVAALGRELSDLRGRFTTLAVALTLLILGLGVANLAFTIYQHLSAAPAAR